MKKCEICGKLYDDSYDKCPYSHLFVSKTANNNDENYTNKKGLLSCLGCLGLILLILLFIILFGKQVEPTQNKRTEETKTISSNLDFGDIQFNSEDLPYLEKVINQYFTDIEFYDYQYHYFIAPDVWNANPYSGKIFLMVRGAAYGAIKTGQIKEGSTHALVQTKIKSNINGETLGTFGLMGYKFK